MSNIEKVGSILKRVAPCLFKSNEELELRVNVLKTYRKYPDLEFEDFTKLYPADIEKVKNIHKSLINKGWL